MTIRPFIKRLLLAVGCYATFWQTAPVLADTKIVPQFLTGTNLWSRTNEYQLNGAVFVRSNAVLHIEAGTVIKGHNLGTFGTNVAALYICRGAKIYAEGTPRNPIIFTADVDDVTLPDDLDIYQRGLWGGVVLFGNASINGALDASGNAASPKYEVYEGLPDLTVEGEPLMRFGGADDDDNSGILRYVSIRHGGAKLSTDKEINGLSLGGVGRGTTIEFVESYAIADDGFEFFGGTVNTKYLVSAFCDDDAFDVDQGHRGTNQFWFGIQAPDARNYGMELNSQVNEIATADRLLPQADFKVYNMTLIGSGAANLNTTGGRNAALILRPFAAPKIYNSVFTDFNERAIELDTRNGVNAATSVTNNYAEFHNNLWWGFVTGSGSGNIDNSITNLSRSTVASTYWENANLSNQIANPMLGGISRTNVGATLDPRPLPGSAAYLDFAPTPRDGFLTPVNFRGAFGSNDLWIAHWTALSQYGILAPAGTHTNIVSEYISGTNYWYRTNEYHLNGAVFVRSNAVLHIEAGTVIKGHNLGTFGTNVAALYICRGARIFAEGTPQNPIIFTADVDDVNLADDLDITQRGLWGGVVIFGNASINGALDASGNTATPKYEVYEGLPDLTVDGEPLMRFGGSNDDDSSGVLRYVSIRHGGAKLSTDKEINGLSLGGVGRGTTIEFVESYAIADDGFEFFGGTVNTKYLVSAFCDDDAFDVDQGHRGTNQFWFGIQAPDARNYGMELNSQVNEIATADRLLPQADFTVYNLTLIGSGVSNANTTGGRNAAVILRPYSAPKIYNSIYTDFNERAIELDTRNGVNGAVSVTNDYAQFHNNLWWGFVTGSGSGNVDNSITNLSRSTIASSFWDDSALTNQISDPLLYSISRTNVGPVLDPRPRENSPALADFAPTPAGFLTPATYRGAFGPGRGGWAADWTALNAYGILSGAGGNNPAEPAAGEPTNSTPKQPTVTLVRNGSGVALTFVTESGFRYEIEAAASLTGLGSDWTADGTPIAGTGGEVTHPLEATGRQRFFRIVIR